jgi:hypothetical protein
VTEHPTSAWTLRQLREAVGYEPYLIHDRDSIQRPIVTVIVHEVNDGHAWVVRPQPAMNCRSGSAQKFPQSGRLNVR